MIKVQNLTKRYGQHLAVDNVSFEVNEGEIVGFLGLNGAGKSTTMNIITGYISATEGDAVINGHNVLDEPEAAKRDIGYLPELPPLYGEMKVDEYLNFVADIKKIKKNVRVDAIEDVKASVKIADMSKRMIKNLSKGYRQRVGLAQALLGDPKVLILDEPTVGLDPRQIIEMRDMIKRLGQKRTVILSSHILTEVSAVCDRVIIIHKGRITAADTTERLSKHLEGNKMLVRIKGDEERVRRALEGNSLITSVRMQHSPEAGAQDAVMEGDGTTDIREAIFHCMAMNGLPILMMRSMELTLEEIFLQVTTGDGGAVNDSHN